MNSPNGRLNGKAFYYAFSAGAKRILENQKELNRINVFPVPMEDSGEEKGGFLKAPTRAQARAAEALQETRQRIPAPERDL